MNTHLPIENLLTVLDVVRKHAPASTAEWFCSSIERYIQDDEIKTIDQALEINACKQGSSPLKKTYKSHRRNQYIFQAHSTIKKDSTKASEELADKAEAFELSTWPDYCDLDEPPKGWTKFSKYLFYAFKYGRIPGERRIEEIVSDLRKPTTSSPIDIHSIRLKL